MTITAYQRRLLNSQEYKGYGGVRRASKELGIPYNEVYLEIRLKPRGYDSWGEYEHAKWERHSRTKKYTRLSTIIRKGLKKLNKSQAWLANTINESRQIVHTYIQGKAFPQKQGVRRKIETALNLRPRSLEEIVKE